MRNKIFFLTLLAVLSVCTLAFVTTESWAQTQSTNYRIFADVFSAGGIESSDSTLYSLQDSIGEAIISTNINATTTSASYGIKSGFREMYPDSSITFSIVDTAVDLGDLTTASASTDTNTMQIAATSANGFSITATGDSATLTSGANTITAIGATAAASSVGTEQFGINLVANTSPSVGSNPSGTSPIGSAANQYNTANLFAWDSGDTVATSSAPVNLTTLTVTYLANIASGTEAGTYDLTITYAATANP